MHDIIDKDVLSVMEQKYSELLQHMDNKMVGLLQEVRELTSVNRSPQLVEFLPTPNSSTRSIPAPKVAVQATEPEAANEKFDKIWTDFNHELLRGGVDTPLGQSLGSVSAGGGHVSPMKTEIDRFERLQEMCQIAGMPIVTGEYKAEDSTPRTTPMRQRPSANGSQPANGGSQEDLSLSDVAIYESLPSPPRTEIFPARPQETNQQFISNPQQVVRVVPSLPKGETIWAPTTVTTPIGFVQSSPSM